MSTGRQGRSSVVAVGAAAVLLTSALGAWRVGAVIAPRPDPMSVSVGGVTYTVTQVEQVKGLTDADLSGMTHGVQSLVTYGDALVTVSVVASAGEAAGVVDPDALRVAVAGGTDGTAPVGSTLRAGTLQAHASVEGAVSFVVPRNGARLTLRTTGSPTHVPLLTLDVAAPQPADGHQHLDVPPVPAASAPPSSPR